MVSVRGDRVTPPRRNVELKARDADPAATLERALALGASDEGVLAQRDTYFGARARAAQAARAGGRRRGGARLIAYVRADDDEARTSSYRLAEVDDPAALADALDAALGTLVVVDKRRRLLLYENVRIHIDDVERPRLVRGARGRRGRPTRTSAASTSSSRACARSWRSASRSPARTPTCCSTAPHSLLAAADAVMRNAYAPYSNFPVGAALRSPSGAIHVGANVENAAYPQGQCAEASAIGAMVAAGDRAITAVAVVAEKLDVCPPCGGCRQRLKEFAAPDTPVYLGRPGGPARRRPWPSCCRWPSTRRRWHDAARGRSRPARARAPRVGIVLGSGLGAVADAVEDAVSVGYDELPGFPRPTVHGHAGRAVLGRLRGVPVCVLMGRAHLYEGGDPAPRVTPVRALAAAGAEVLVLTNAAGSLRPEVGPGPPHGDLRPHQPHRAQPADRPQRRGHRPALPEPGRRLRPGAARRAARQRRRARRRPRRGRLPRGQRAELRDPGRDPRLRARWAPTRSACRPSTRRSWPATPGLRVAAVSAISNLAEGLSDVPLSHEQTLTDAGRAAGDLARLLEDFVGRLA